MLKLGNVAYIPHTILLARVRNMRDLFSSESECFTFSPFFPPSDAGEQRDLINMIGLAIDNSEATRIRLRDVSENIPWPVVTVVLFIFCLIPTIKFGKRSHMVVHHQPISHATRITACRQLATKRRPNKRKSEN